MKQHLNKVFFLYIEEFGLMQHCGEGGDGRVENVGSRVKKFPA